MKKLLKVLLTILVIIGTVSVYEHVFQHDHHVHAVDYGPGDLYGNCPSCGANTFYIMDVYQFSTCTEGGSAMAMCRDCGYSADVTWAANGHTWVYEGEEQPTCTETGTRSYYCDVCGESRDDVLPALGHSYNSEITTQPTCTQTGVRTYTCARCQHSYTESEPALGHNYVAQVTKQPTCTVDGVTTYTCSRCNDSRTESIKATGHNYTSAVTKEPTCTTIGTRTYTCSNCNSSYSESIPSLGHNYTSAVTKEATCTEAGEKTFTCDRCHNSYTESIAAIGHDYVTETTKEATCTEAGVETHTCNNCGDVYESSIPATGHDLGDYVIKKEATCEEEGLREATCKTCGYVEQEVIPKLIHEYPEEWATEKEPGIFTEGVKTKTCTLCGSKIEEKIPALVNPIIAIIAVGALALIGALIYFLRKPKLKVPVPELKKDLNIFKPSYETKTIVIATENEKILELLKKQSYLEVIGCEYDDLGETIEENEPDIVICDVPDQERLNEISEAKKESFPDTELGLIVPKQQLPVMKATLDGYKEEKFIIDYIVTEKSAYNSLVKIVLPVLKPDLKSCESLENLANMTDILGIPFVSTAINIFVAGRDIKETFETGEVGAVEGATIITDIAAILGLEEIESIASLVVSADTIKASFDEEAGAYEKKEGRSAARDVAETISDIIS